MAWKRTWMLGLLVVGLAVGLGLTLGPGTGAQEERAARPSHYVVVSLDASSERILDSVELPGPLKVAFDSGTGKPIFDGADRALALAMAQRALHGKDPVISLETCETTSFDRQGHLLGCAFSCSDCEHIKVTPKN